MQSEQVLRIELDRSDIEALLSGESLSIDAEGGMPLSLEYNGASVEVKRRRRPNPISGQLLQDFDETASTAAGNPRPIRDDVDQPEI